MGNNPGAEKGESRNVNIFMCKTEKKKKKTPQTWIKLEMVKLNQKE
jgi:hypothetical protein